MQQVAEFGEEAGRVECREAAGRKVGPLAKDEADEPVVEQAGVQVSGVQGAVERMEG